MATKYQHFTESQQDKTARAKRPKPKGKNYKASAKRSKKKGKSCKTRAKKLKPKGKNYKARAERLRLQSMASAHAIYFWSNDFAHLNDY